MARAKCEKETVDGESREPKTERGNAVWCWSAATAAFSSIVLVHQSSFTIFVCTVLRAAEFQRGVVARIAIISFFAVTYLCFPRPSARCTDINTVSMLNFSACDAQRNYLIRREI